MDTISRENNSSMLPVGGIIVGVIALLLGGYAAISISKVNKALADLQPKIDKIDSVEMAANSAASSAENVKKDLTARMREIQKAFEDVGGALTNITGSVTRLEEAAKKAPVAAPSKKGGGEPPVAGPGEYVVKAGDTGMKIATSNNVSVSDLQAVNPSVNWNKLAPGQKLKLPAKK